MMNPMARFASTILCAALCALTIAAPARAWEDMPAAAAEAIKRGATPWTCGTECPAGTIEQEYTGLPAFKDCTEAYQYQIHYLYEPLLGILMHYAPAYGHDYLAACRARLPERFAGREILAMSIADHAERELAAVRPAMRRLIAGPLSQLVPAHCRANKPAQDEVAAQFDDWYAKAAAYHKEQLMGITQEPHIECGHFNDATVARVYDVPFSEMPVLGLTAVQIVLQNRESLEARKIVLDYKDAVEAVQREQSASSAPQSAASAH